LLSQVVWVLEESQIRAERLKVWGTYPQLLHAKPPSYSFAPAAQLQFAIAATQDLIDMIGSWMESFDHTQPHAPGRSPRPKPVLRMMPGGSKDPRSERGDESNGHSQGSL
jgi:hypothetical protein